MQQELPGQGGFPAGIAISTNWVEIEIRLRFWRMSDGLFLWFN
jgi:hypothetical protein